jgi:3-oxoacyl-[acyl-carrier protein] reductase
LALLSDRIALITGASRGIGRAIAEIFAANGASLVLCARGPATCEVAEGLRAQGAHVVGLQGDITDELFVKQITRAVRSEFGRLDILVNNAGIIEQARLGMMPSATMQAMFDVNVRAVITLTQFAVRMMDPARDPSVINISSIAGTAGLDGATAYSATKGAVTAFTRAAAKELAPAGIRVNAIAPGFIETDAVASLAPDWRARRVLSIGLGRPGTPADVAGAALFLASPLAGYITGQVIGVDGGMLA